MRFVFMLAITSLASSMSIVDCEGDGTEEICNGIDDDGNGLVDDGLPFSVSGLSSVAIDTGEMTGSATYEVCGDTGTLELYSRGLQDLVFTGVVEADVIEDGYSSVVPLANRSFTATWSIDHDGQYDSAGIYGDLASGHWGTLVWPYSMGEVVPWPVGQDEAITVNGVATLGIPSGASAYSSVFQTPFNSYQFSYAVDYFRPYALVGSTDADTTVKVVANSLNTVESADLQLSSYATGQLQWYEHSFSPYMLRDNQMGGVVTLLGINWCPSTESSCAYGGMEEHPVAKISYSNMEYLDSYGGDASVTRTQYYSGVGVTAHELAHAFGPGGVVVRPRCVADFLPFGEGWATWLSDVARAEADGLHTQQAFTNRHLSGVDYYIANNADMIVWPTACNEAPGSVPPNYAVITYERGGLFWADYAAYAGGDRAIISWASDLHDRAMAEPNLYAMSGDELLDDAAEYLGVDAREIPVTLTNGQTTDLATGWLRTVGARPVMETARMVAEPVSYEPGQSHPNMSH